MKYFHLYHYIVLFAVLLAGSILSTLSLHTLKIEVVESFVFALKDNVSDRLRTPDFEKTSQFVPMDKKVHDLTGKKGGYITTEEGTVLMGLPSSAANQVEGKSYFVLEERIDQTALHIIRPFVPSEIDSLWILELEKRSLSGRTTVTLRYPPDTIVSAGKGSKKNILFCETFDIYMGLDREIKATGSFSYSFLTLLARHPYLWFLYLVMLFFTGFFVFNKKKRISYIINVQQNNIGLDWDKAVIAPLTDGTYQIGGYWFKPETNELLWKGEEPVKWTTQSAGLLLLFLKSDEYKLSYEAIKASQITASSDYHHIISRFKTNFRKDPRIKIENIYKWGFRLFIEDDITT